MYKTVALAASVVDNQRFWNFYLRGEELSTDLQNFLKLSYGELEDLNLAAKEQRMKRVPIEKIREDRLKYLKDEKRIKAVTCCSLAILKAGCTCWTTTKSSSWQLG
jgi:hypothetical protein